jgi:hypothetical protein
VAAPRFLFVTGASREGVPMLAWPDRYTSASGHFAADGRWIAWRLAGPNNRELGRSASVYPDYLACLEGVKELLARLEELHPLITLNHVTGLWTWRLDDDGTAIAVSGRGHQRRRECEYNLGRFLATAAVAVPATNKSIGRPPRGAA